MKDGIGRKIEYLRLSITDKCNLRCAYCMPGEGVFSMSHEEILRYEEIIRLVSILAGLGLKKVRITGGEPTVRKDMTELIRQIGRIGGIEEMALTTNGLLFADMAPELKEAGLDGVNISIDSMDEEVYRSITGYYGAGRVLKAIDTALALDFKVKLNCVPIKGVNEASLTELALLARDNDIDVRFIELMPLGCGKKHEGLGSDEVLDLLEKDFGRMERISSAPERKLSGPARCYRPEGFAGRIGFISPLSHKFCSECNRIRLTPDGFLKLCLHRSDGISLRDMIRRGAGDAELTEAVTDAIMKKPTEHDFFCGSGEKAADSGEDRDSKEEKRLMNAIGG